MGRESAACDWPNVVSVEAPGVGCSGSLVHPNVVLYAAHCGTSITHIGFGSNRFARRVVPMRCAVHPDYLTRSYPDLAICVLPTAVDDVPIIPLLAPCEAAHVRDSAPAVIVGFGLSNTASSSAGIKREGDVYLSVWPPTGWTAIGILSSPATPCAGDSGGPTFLRLPDRTWRQIGVHVRGDQTCSLPGSGGVDHAVHNHLAWIESESGYDVSPCDDGGVWRAGPDCRNLMTDQATGSWPACERGPVLSTPVACGGDVAPLDGGGAALDAARLDIDAGGVDGGGVDGGGVDAGGLDGGGVDGGGVDGGGNLDGGEVDAGLIDEADASRDRSDASVVVGDAGRRVADAAGDGSRPSEASPALSGSCSCRIRPRTSSGASLFGLMVILAYFGRCRRRFSRKVADRA